MWYTELLCWVTFLLIHINEFFKNSGKFNPVIFLTDRNLFMSNSKRQNLFETTNEELRKAEKRGLKLKSFA